MRTQGIAVGDLVFVESKISNFYAEVLEKIDYDNRHPEFETRPLTGNAVNGHVRLVSPRQIKRHWKRQRG